MLKSERNRQNWNGKKIGGKVVVNLQLKRLMSMQFVGRAWTEVHENPKYAEMHSNAWVKSGCLLTADGTDDAKVSPQSTVAYTVPA